MYGKYSVHLTNTGGMKTEGLSWKVLASLQNHSVSQ